MRHFSPRFYFSFALLLAGCLFLTTGCGKNRNASKTLAASGSTTNANPAKLALAQHLTKTGAKMYGTFWCPYCHRQQELFGGAASQVPVVECDPKGTDAQPESCASANVQSFPTWKINGQLYRGLRSLEELAVISNYKGSTQFDQHP
jgi:glutaredoxin